jgi:hypothetical protein
MTDRRLTVVNREPSDGDGEVAALRRENARLRQSLRDAVGGLLPFRAHGNCPF